MRWISIVVGWVLHSMTLTIVPGAAMLETPP